MLYRSAGPSGSRSVEPVGQPSHGLAVKPTTPMRPAMLQRIGAWVMPELTGAVQASRAGPKHFIGICVVPALWALYGPGSLYTSVWAARRMPGERGPAQAGSTISQRVGARVLRPHKRYGPLQYTLPCNYKPCTGLDQYHLAYKSPWRTRAIGPG